VLEGESVLDFHMVVVDPGMVAPGEGLLGLALGKPLVRVMVVRGRRRRRRVGKFDVNSIWE